MIVVNGVPRELPEPATVGSLLDAMGIEPRRRGIAVALGGEVVPRAGWDGRALRDGDRVEVVTAIQGG